MTDSLKDIASNLLKQAKKHGADAADALIIKHDGIDVEIRDGLLENFEHANDIELGLRVFCGKKCALISTGNPSLAQSEQLAQKAVTMAKVLPDDPYGGLCKLAKNEPQKLDLDLVDPQEKPSVEQLIAYAREAEKSALSVRGVTKSSGSSCGWDQSTITLLTSEGFCGSYSKTYFSGSACAIAGQGEAMQRDYDFHCSTHHRDLKSAQEIGKKAGENAVARLNPTQPKTKHYSVVFDPRVANSFLQHFAQLANGKAIAGGTSLLKEKLNQQIFPENITILDDPHRIKGLRSRPFDGEGVPTQNIAHVQDGILKHWFLDSHSARQLGLKTHGQAGRSVSSQPHPSASNLYFSPGKSSPAQLMADIAEGIYVTEMMGMSLNSLTGDYSRGASGFMIRNGVLAEPISGFTLAGNLIDVFASISLADDLTFKFGTNSPTLRTEALNVAGS